MKNKKSKSMNVKYMIITQDEEKAFLCYNIEKSEISFCYEFEDRISLFQSKQDAQQFIDYVAPKINMKLTPMELPLGELFDDTKVSHLINDLVNKQIKGDK